MNREIPEYLETEWQTAKDEYKVKTTSYITITKFEYEKLQQENQNLKEALENLEIINAERSNLIVEDMKELVKYKSVLDEIREYIKSHISYEKNSDGYAEPYLSGYAIKGSLEILDKVGIE